ncbi:TIGR03759 family integrating conjugative element protein [Pantoea sp. Taur]|nr:TIGR03759 family integrating conjugative element protein [Pantoea sp. Taur]
MFSKAILFVLLISVAFITSSKEPDSLNSNNSNLAYANNKQLLFQDIYFDGNNFDSERYRKLMAGIRGKLSPHLDPISLLGIEARNDAERRHYAELWVKQEYERTEKELKFQREVDAAWKRLMPNMLPVNMGNAAGVAHDSGGRLALFVREADCQRCDARLSAVLADKRPVDIYLVDSEGNDQKLRNWAQQHRIPAEQVRERRITLNHDAGRWMRYGNGIMPVLLQQGESGWHIAAF